MLAFVIDDEEVALEELSDAVKEALPDACIKRFN